MSALNKTILLIVTALLTGLAAGAQERKVTPVEVDDNKPQQPIWHHYDKHGNALKEPVLFLAELDTVKKVSSGPVFPLLTSVTVGVNVFDLAMQAFGQSYANIDVWGNVSLHNWFIPTVELGVGYGSKHPADGNYRYKAKPGLYCRIGADYNFLYKSTPKYQPLVGLRAGFSSFGYDITDVNMSSDYWGENQTFNLNGQRATAFYGQVVAGVKVEIANNWSLGWTGRYSFMFHCSKGKNSDPWFIPGFGASNNKVTATFSVMYTFPLCDYTSVLERAKNRALEVSGE